MLSAVRQLRLYMVPQYFSSCVSNRTCSQVADKVQVSNPFKHDESSLVLVISTVSLSLMRRKHTLAPSPNWNTS